MFAHIKIDSSGRLVSFPPGNTDAHNRKNSNDEITPQLVDENLNNHKILFQYRENDIIARCEPWVFAIDEYKLATNCYRCLAEKASELKRCSMCTYAYYCGKKCQVRMFAVGNGRLKSENRDGSPRVLRIATGSSGFNSLVLFWLLKEADWKDVHKGECAILKMKEFHDRRKSTDAKCFTLFLKVLLKLKVGVSFCFGIITSKAVQPPDISRSLSENTTIKKIKVQLSQLFSDLAFLLIKTRKNTLMT